MTPEPQRHFHEELSRLKQHLLSMSGEAEDAVGHAVDALLGRTPSLRRDPVRPEELPGLEEAITPRGDVRTLPSMGVDGFYIARMQC